MEFIITWTRTDSIPCKEASPRDAVYIDRRTVKTLKEAEKEHWGREFFERGSNHREELGMIARDLEGHKIYVINIDTLESLLAFSNKYGRIILSEEDDYKGYKYSLEIFDNYRE